MLSVVAVEVVVGFGGVGAVVACFAQVTDVGFEVPRDGVAATHVLGSHGGGITSHEDGGASHGADGGVGVSGSEAGSAGCQGVEIGGLSLLVAIATEPMGGVVLSGDPEDVWAVGRYRGESQ